MASAVWSPQIEKQLGRSLKELSEVQQVIIRGMMELSVCWERALSEETFAVYLKYLSDLSPSQLETAFDRAGKECEFWPVPAVLRRLAGTETAAQYSERRALEDLSFLVEYIRKHGIEGRARNGVMIEPEHRDENRNLVPARFEKIPPPPIPDSVHNAVAEFGYGSQLDGVKAVAEHPALCKDPDLYANPGLKMAMVEKLEQRWIAAWRRANSDNSQSGRIAA